MKKLKFDRIKYETVMLSRKNNFTYAYDRARHPDWHEAGSDTLYICHPICDDGDIFSGVHIVLRKEELLLSEG
jgi:hypothetical protein